MSRPQSWALFSHFRFRPFFRFLKHILAFSTVLDDSSNVCFPLLGDDTFFLLDSPRFCIQNCRRAPTNSLHLLNPYTCRIDFLLAFSSKKSPALRPRLIQCSHLPMASRCNSALPPDPLIFLQDTLPLIRSRLGNGPNFFPSLPLGVGDPVVP